MTKTIIITAISSLLSLSAIARTVDLPLVDKSAHLTFIRSVELTETATRFNMSMIGRPGKSISIDSMVIKGHETGKVYQLMRSEGYQPGITVTMGPGGRMDYVNVFPALDPADSIVDMYDKKMPEKITDIQQGIHLGKSPVGKYFARLHGRHNGPTGFIAVQEAAATIRGIEPVWIPVDNGEFSATFRSDKPVFYEIMDGVQYLSYAWMSSNFLPEGEDVEVNFTYDSDDNEVKDVKIKSAPGSQTQAYADHRQYISDLWDNSEAVRYRDSLEAAGAYYLPQYYEAMEIMHMHPEKKDSLAKVMSEFWKQDVVRTPEGTAAEKAVKDFSHYTLDSIKIRRAMDMHNLAGLFVLTTQVHMARDYSKYLDAYRRVYAGMYPGHPYSVAFEELDSTFDPAPGNPFNDFTAPDFAGNQHRLSELIKGRPALIDLWASTCGPCRKNSKSMIPVYNEFAPKGFTIVGVAREYDGPASGERAIKTDGYPWLNLLELDDRAGIWALYRCQNAMGGTFLVDADGKIVTVNPTPDEVRAYLSTHLK